MILTLLLAQAIVNVPAEPRPEAAPPADLNRLSIVVADAVSETDPHPLCGRPGCLSLFLGRYANAVVLAGPAVSPRFEARVEMGSPFISRYRLALIVEHRPGREALIRSMAGFNDRTHEACFEAADTRSWNWDVGGPKIIKRGQAICVTQ